MHPRARVVLGDDQERRRTVQPRAARRTRPGGSSSPCRMPSPVPGTGTYCASSPLAAQRVVAGAEEGEVVVAQPVEQLARLVGLAAGPAERPGPDLRGELGGDADGPLGHRVPVGDRDPDEVEHLVDARARGRPPRRPRARAGPGGSSSRCIHDSCRRVRLLGGLRRAQQLLQPTLGVAQHQELRVEHLADGPALPQHLHRHRVDEEGQVVGDDLQHRRPAEAADRRRRPAVEIGGRRPAVVPPARRRGPRPGRVADQRRAVVALDERQELVDRTVLEVGRVDVAEVVPHEGRDRVRVLPELARHRDARRRRPRRSCRSCPARARPRTSSRHHPSLPKAHLVVRHDHVRRCPPGWLNGRMDISTDLDFAATPAEVHAMMLDRGYQEQVCVASESTPLGGRDQPAADLDLPDAGGARVGRPVHRPRARHPRGDDLGRGGRGRFPGGPSSC